MSDSCSRAWSAGFIDGLFFATFILLFLIACAVGFALVEALQEGE